MPVINGVYLKDFAALPGAVDDANIIPIAISGNQVAYRTTVSGIITDARITGKLLTGLSVTGTAILATDTILAAFGKVQNQLNNRVSSVGLTMPSAFSVANSPVTTSGTLAVTAAGLASQYIRGDGTLADFPTEGGGGGSSVSYYLNGSVSQGTIGGNLYHEMNKTPVLGAGTDFTIASNGYIAQFLTDANDPNTLLIPAGNFNLEFYFSASSSGGTPSYYVELYKYDGATFTLIASNSTTPEVISLGTIINPYFSTLAVPETILLATDRLAIRVYVTNSGKTITMHTEDNHLCQIITTFTTGLQSLNGLSKQAQYFAVGSSGTDFAIVSSVDTHTFNIPSASASNRGLITTGTQTIAGDKTFSGNINANSLINIPTTTASVGAIYQNSERFIHSYTGAGMSSPYKNISIGNNAGNFTQTNTEYGYGNIGLGTNVHDGITTGNNNISIGAYSESITTGTNNVTIGSQDGFGGITTGSGNTILGHNGSSNSGTITNNIILNSGGQSRATFDGTNWSFSGGATITGQLTLNSTISNGTYTYTLPSATGTLALTSALSSYVTLGTSQTITGQKTFNSGSGLTIDSTTPVPVPTKLFATNVQSLAYVVQNTSNAFSANFSGTVTANRTYTIPNASGTLALTSDLTGGTVTSVAALTLGTSGTDLNSTVATPTTTPVITLNVPTASASNRGALSSTDWNTFNGKQAALSGTGIVKSTAGVISYLTDPLPITNGGTGSATKNFVDLTTDQTIGGFKTFSSSVTIANGTAHGLNLEIGTSGNYSSLKAATSGGSTNILLPASSGTLALTSALSSYLPLAGGTLTGALSGTSATFSGAGLFGSTSGVVISSSAAMGRVIGTNAAGNASAELLLAGFPLTFTGNGGGGAEHMRITSGGSVLINTTTDAGYKLDVNGTGRFSGLLTAISTATTLVRAATIGNTSTNTLSAASLGFNLGGGDYGAIEVGYNSANPYMDFKVGSSLTQSLRLASTGAATFSSSVTATSFFESSDSRLKTLVSDNYQTNGIESILPRLYEKGGIVELGYYAQDVQKVLPSAVVERMDGFLDLSYRQVHTAKIANLENRIKQLEDLIKQLI